MLDYVTSQIGLETFLFNVFNAVNVIFPHPEPVEHLRNAHYLLHYLKLCAIHSSSLDMEPSFTVITLDLLKGTKKCLFHFYYYAL